jgi:glycolate oxidase iron-sulfur subunit
MTHAVEACVHCGFCLAACPTYRELGQEMDTPRGRIVLMKQVLEGTLAWKAAQPHIDRCLGCLACEPACPSGVPYRDLITPFRALAESHFTHTTGQKVRRFLALQALPYPNRLRLAARLGHVVKPFSRFAPASLRPMLDLLPGSLPLRERWPAQVPAQGQRRARVALLLGCAQQVLAPEINSATIAVLTRSGVEVVIPQEQGCCGGLAWHTGDLNSARTAARQNLHAFPQDIDAIVTNAAGCGSALQEYALILRGMPEEAAGSALSKRAMDVTVFLARLGLREGLRPLQGTRKIAYHDACHLANAQNVRSEPRALLQSIPGIELIELANPEICCGSAGTYNLDQPAIAAALGMKKAQAAIATGADLLSTGNIGCLMQLRAHLMRAGSPLRVRHTMEVLADAHGKAA